MANLEKLVEELSAPHGPRGRSAQQALLEEKWGVSAAAPGQAAAAAGGGAAAAPAEVKDEFTVVPRAAGDKKRRRHQGCPRDHRSRPQGS